MGTPQDAYCTLLVTDGYLPGAMVLAHSLRDRGTKKLLVALVTLDTVSATTIDQLQTVYDQVIPVDRIINKTPVNLYLMERPDLGSVFTKIALWRQVQFRRIVYIDADVVVLRAPDELFVRESAFAAAPDVGWPDCFNSGVMALSPNMGDYYALLALAQRGISFDGADQGLLNMHFTNWDRFSFTYNCTPSAHYQYVPAYKHFQSSISLIHYIGRDKPWLIGREARGSGGVYEELLGRWWAVYDRHYRFPTHGYTPNRTVQQHVFGEYQPPPESIYTFHPPALAPPPAPEPGSKPASIGASLLDQPDPDEITETQHLAPAPTVEQTPFSAPQSEWDPTRQPPPAQSRPEAANFPRHTYPMSGDRNLFQAPKSYPEPPKDMWYGVPSKSPAPEQPKQIFPWEGKQPKPTRVFAEEPPPPPLPPLSGPDAPIAVNTSTDSTQDDKVKTPDQPIIHVTSSEPFESFSRSNAWDEMPGIERYMNRLNFIKRGVVQVVHSSAAPSQSSDVSSPVSQPSQRRSSMKLTDFPTELERPSLPVTPAPVRKHNFWGQGRDAEGELPPAEGVPKQQDWDPLKKLQELQRKQSEVLARVPVSPSEELPRRTLPASAQLVPTSEETEVAMSSVSSDNHVASPTARDDSRTGSVGFRSTGGVEPDDAKSGADEGIFSPTGADS